MPRDRLLLAGLLLAVTLAALPVLTYPLGRDQGEFATIGRGILDGRVPYVDLWNPKPPAVFYVYALAMAVFGRTTVALRAIDFLIVPIISLSLYWLGGRIADRRVGLRAALLFPVFYFTETFWTLTQNDGIALLPMVLLVVCLFKMTDAVGATWQVAPTTWRAAFWGLAAGALLALTFWFKYPFVLMGVVFGRGYIVWRGNRRPDATERAAVLAFLLGGVAVIAGGFIFLGALGALPDFFESARVTSQYAANTSNLEDFVALLQPALDSRWQQWGVLWILAVLWFVLGRVGTPRSSLWGIVMAWLIAGALIMLVQAKAYDYHWLPMLPPLVLMAADSVNRLIAFVTSSGGRGLKIIIPALTALAFLCIMLVSIWPRVWPYLYRQESQVAYYGKFQAGEFVADESLQVAAYLREHTTPGDSLFIWGFRPEVYYLSELKPATRFIFQFPLVADWYPAAWRQETVNTLWAALPPYVLVLQVDYMPWVTGSNDDSNTLLQAYTELNNWLIFNYERETQIGNFFIWRRKPS